jgi:hypothetical protein
MVGPRLGPTRGGWITDNYNCLDFFINVPLGIIAFIMVVSYVRGFSTPGPRHDRFDVLGMVLLTIAVGSLQWIAGARGALMTAVRFALRDDVAGDVRGLPPCS